MRTLKIFVLCLLASHQYSNAAVFNVNDLTDQVDIIPGDGLCETANKSCTLRAAIMETNALFGADEIILPAGTTNLSLAGANEDMAASGDLDLTESISITGLNANESFIDADGLDRVIDVLVQPGTIVNITGLTIKNGLANLGSLTDRVGGGVRTADGVELVLKDVVIDSNSATYGGGIYNQGNLSGTEVRFIHNTVDGFGGAIVNQGIGVMMHLNNCLFDDNSAGAAAAVIITADLNHARGQASLSHCSVINNNSTNSGIVLNNTNTDFTISNSTFSDNQSSSVLFNDGGSVFFIRNSTIINNQATGIAEVHFNDQFIFMSNTVLTQNTGTVGVNCSRNLTSEGGNFFGDLTGCAPTMHPSDMVSLNDPVLTPLDTYLYPWRQVHWPRLNSPLLDAGIEDLCEPSDQLHMTRPNDSDFHGVSKCTIGAVENTELIFANGFAE